MSIVIFAGEDSFRLQSALKKFLNKEAPGASTQTFESDSSEEITLELREFFKAVTLWQERRIAIAKTPAWKGKLPETTTGDLLILALEKPPTASISKNARVELFPQLKGAELSAWIREIAKGLGNSADSSLVSALIQLHGSDSAAIWNELMTLSCFKPREKLSANDLKTFRSWLPQIGDFAFVEAVLNRNRGRSLSLLLQSLNTGVAPLSLLAGITTNFRAMLVAKCGDASTEKFFAGRHPFWISKINQASEKFSEDELKNQLRRLERAERMIKTGKHAPETALEEFVLGA